MRSNDPPLPGEEAALLANITSYNEPLRRLELEGSGLRAFLLDLQSQMDEVSYRVEMLRQERARISQAVRERQIVFSPLRRFPAEILCHILLHAIEFPVRRTLLATESPPYSSSWDFPDPKPICGPSLLCRSSGEVSLSLSRSFGHWSTFRSPSPISEAIHIGVSVLSYSALKNSPCQFRSTSLLRVDTSFLRR